MVRCSPSFDPNSFQVIPFLLSQVFVEFSKKQQEIERSMLGADRSILTPFNTRA